MGYQKKGVELDGMFMMGSGFLDVGTTTDSYDIQMLVPEFPTDAEDALADGEAQIQEVSTGGEIGTIYFYLVPGSIKTGFDGTGWYTYDAGTYTKATKTFVRGEGFLYAAPYAFKLAGETDDEEQLATTLQSAGAVNLEAKTLELNLDGLWTLSFDRPVETSIQKLVPSFPEDAEDPLADCEAQVQEISTGGEIGTIYFYLVSGSTKTGFDGAGWYTYDAGIYTKATKTFAPGEGFLYMAPYAFMMESEDEVQLTTYLTFEK